MKAIQQAPFLRYEGGSRLPSPGLTPLPQHLPTLDYLRGAAIIMVLLFHFYGSVNWSLYAGNFVGPFVKSLVSEFNFGVQLFFLLSGFLITTTLFRARGKPDYFRSFYVKRALRILPVFLVTLIALKLFLPISWRFFVASCFFLSNFAPLFGARSSEFGPLWSLCVEEHFYLLWPTCVSRFSPSKLIPFLTSVIIIEPLLRFIAISLNAQMDIRFKTPFMLDYISYGALLAVLIHTGKLHSRNLRKLCFGLLAVSTPLIALTLYLDAFHYTLGLDALRPVPWTWLCSGVLLTGLERDTTRPPKTKHTMVETVLLFFAYISYGLYLISPFVNAKLYPFVGPILTKHGLNNGVHATGMLLTDGSLAVAIAYLSRRFFEQPCLDLKEKILSQQSSRGDAIDQGI